MKTRIIFSFAVCVLTLDSIKVSAATINWIGTSTLWSTAANWSPAQVPTNLDNVIISATGKNPTVDVAAQCASLDITGTIKLTLSANLTVTGTLTIEDAVSLTIPAGSNQTLTVNGKTTLLGSNLFTVNASNTVILNAMDMISDNTSTTKISNKGTFQVTGILSMNSSILSTNNTQIANSGTFNAGASGTACTINMNDFATIANTGAFYAGISGTACTLNLSGNSSSITNKTAGTHFYLGPSSVINVSGTGVSISNSASSTFTIQSDVTGSGTIGAITGTAAPFTGNYNVERFITGGIGHRGYRLLSSPVGTGNGYYSINYLINSCFVTGTTGAAGGFDTAPGNPNNPTIYLFRENLAPSNSTFTGGNFRGINKINNAIAGSYNVDIDGSPYDIYTGAGFLFFFRGDRNAAGQTLSTENAAYTPTSTTLTATGKINTGPVTVRNWFGGSTSLFETTKSGSPSIEGFNLVGNPFPSSIDWDTYNTNAATPNTGIYTPVSGVGPFIYILMPNGGYNIYEQGMGGVSTNNGIANSNIIPSGQGFFVIATGATPTLTFNESAKTNSQATTAIGNLFLGAPPKPIVNQYLHLMIARDSVNEDGILINFNSNAKPQCVANEDAPYKTGTGPASITSLSADNVALGINTLPLPKLIPETIALNVNANADGVYKLNMTAIKSIPDLYEIWLMDAYKKDSFDFRHNPTYSFNIARSDAASYGSNRFSLVIRQNPLLQVHLLSFTATKATNGAQVIWKTEHEQNYTNFILEKSTDNGKTFDDLDGFLSTAQGTYSFVDKAPISQPNVTTETTVQYRLKIADLNGGISYSKVAILMYSSSGNNIAAGNITVYPNPARSVINLAIAQNGGLSSNLPALQQLNANPGLASPAVSAQSYDIKIINITGFVVKTATSLLSNWQDNINSLPPGTYIIQVANSNDKSLIGKSTFIKL